MIRILILLVLLLLAGCSTVNEEAGNPPQQKKLAPEFMLTTMDRQEIELSDYRGKWLLMNFWTSWCPPCKEEAPVLQKLQERYEGQLKVLGVNLTYQDDRKEVAEFLEENGVKYDIVLDKFGEVSKLYQVQALPTLFFISPDGEMVKTFAGALSEEQFIKEIDGLLSKK